MDIKPNLKNPRQITKDKFKKLKESIKSFPKMLELRPIVVDENGMILGGNMRFKALQDLGWEIKPEWVKVANELTEDERQRFIIEDNVEFGKFDWDMLANEWDENLLTDWGLDLPKLAGEMMIGLSNPQYEPSDVRVSTKELFKENKVVSDEEIDEIEDENIKALIRIRQAFFVDFSFDKIADYFVNQASEKEKEIFKRLGLVLLDYEDMVKLGFCKTVTEWSEGVSNE